MTNDELLEYIEMLEAKIEFKDKALFLIDNMLCCLGREPDEIYKWAHVALGRCGNAHRDWKDEMLRAYDETYPEDEH